ncbi:predicted protein [Arabidopsis lyrata subsp. lyrata]|uniref:Predicted protein n=1 Tax=Arabidopsis lyrata subsp. lyrata TaxID=81972 RepID=D7KJD3_ARALL|nr:predicted protein [Arabidopsis lyrata subsp. lyrata]
MWRIWKSRNDFLFQKVNRRPESTAQKGIHDVNDWIAATQEQEEETRTLSTSTDPPPRRRNRDGQDCRGQVILSGCARLQSSTSALQAEALGFLHVLQVA